MPACFHADTDLAASFPELAIELLGFFSVFQSPLAAVSSDIIYERYLLKARVVITTYNQHVRLLSPEPFGWLPPPEPTRAWEPTLLWNHETTNPENSRIMSIRALEFCAKTLTALASATY